MVRVDLATDIADMAERFKAIHASSEAAKAVVRELKPVLGVDMPIAGSPWLMTSMASLYGRSNLARQLPPMANVLISNVPGPAVPLYVAGARMGSFYPVSIPYHGSALNITVQSYAGQLDFGFIACRRILSQEESYELIGHLKAALTEIGRCRASKPRRHPRRHRPRPPTRNRPRRPRRSSRSPTAPLQRRSHAPAPPPPRRHVRRRPRSATRSNPQTTTETTPWHHPTHTQGQPHQDYSADDEALFSKISWRLLPLLIVCYIIAFLDRVNIGFAQLQMKQTLPFSDAAYAFGAGVFFIGYFLFEVPSNLMLEKIGARKTLLRIMFCWGIVASAMMFVETTTMFYILRFLLGALRGGFLPRHHPVPHLLVSGPHGAARSSPSS